MTKIRRTTGYIIGCVLGLLAIVIVIVYGLHSKNKAADAEAAVTPKPSEFVFNADEQGLASEVDTVSYEVLQDGLNGIGFLTTEEYYFTEVVTREKSKELLKTGITIPLTESNYVASYDGVVNAGVDFSKITVSVDSTNSTPVITIRIPKPEIQTVSIDHDSFVLYSEKTGIGNPFSAEEYNESLTGLEDIVREKAIDKGILTSSQENAKRQIETFVNSLCYGKSYTLQIIVK